jgi:hypothetical protein
MNAFTCSVIPIGVAAGFVGLVYHFRPQRGDFSAFYAIPVFLIGFLIVLVTIPLGIYSIRSGIAADRDPEARGKPLAMVAIVLGILDIVTVTGGWLWYGFESDMFKFISGILSG